MLFRSPTQNAATARIAASVAVTVAVRAAVASVKTANQAPAGAGTHRAAAEPVATTASLF